MPRRGLSTSCSPKPILVEWKVVNPSDQENIDKLMESLNSLIGLDRVKKDIVPNVIEKQ